jgi:thiol-disulfide isomerase/thioredoxin
MDALPSIKITKRHLLLLLVLFFLGRQVWSQEKPQVAIPERINSDALTYLTQVLEKYAQANSYYLESVEETRIKNDFHQSSSKKVTTAIVDRNNRYRFEIRSDTGIGVQVSDGKIEWIYYPPFQQYTEQPTPQTGPRRIQSPTAGGLSALMGAQRAAKAVAQMLKLIRTATYGHDEVVLVNGQNISCTVIETEGEFPGSSKHLTIKYTFWIDKQSNVIRKLTSRQDGAAFPSRPDLNVQIEQEEVFATADLNPPSFADGTFTFKPPIDATLVKEFEDPASAAIRLLVGKQAPRVNLAAADGKEISLESFRGKIVLLDFWATWCVPCLESLPAIEKFYRETRDKDLVILSVDEDEEPQKAAQFWKSHNEPWQNYHGGSEAMKQFPEHGIPYFVLIDGSGKIIFSHAGLDEAGLRAALTDLVSSQKR